MSTLVTHSTITSMISEGASANPSLVIVVTLLIILINKEIVMTSSRERIKAASHLLDMMIAPLMLVLGIMLLIALIQLMR